MHLNAIEFAANPRLDSAKGQIRSSDDVRRTTALTLVSGLSRITVMSRVRILGQSHRRVGSLSKIDVDDQLPFGGMAGNVTFARRILRKYDAACGESADVTIARLELHLTGEPDHKHTVRWIMPAHLAHARRDVTDIAPRRCECVREMQRRIVFKKLPRLQSDIDVLHVRFAAGIGENSKTRHTLIGSFCGI